MCPAEHNWVGGDSYALFLPHFFFYFFYFLFSFTNFYYFPPKFSGIFHHFLFYKFIVSLPSPTSFFALRRSFSRRHCRRISAVCRNFIRILYRCSISCCSWCFRFMSAILSEILRSGFMINSSLRRRTHLVQSFSVVFLYWFYVFSWTSFIPQAKISAITPDRLPIWDS